LAFNHCIGEVFFIPPQPEALARLGSCEQSLLVEWDGDIDHVVEKAAGKVSFAGGEVAANSRKNVPFLESFCGIL
jgi:hypothetical protein